MTKKGFTNDVIAKIEEQLESTFDITFVFNRWTLGDEFCKKVLNISDKKLNDQNLNILKEIGFTQSDINKANEYVCGTMTIEGAPYLKEEHLLVVSLMLFSYYLRFHQYGIVSKYK